MVKRFGLFVAGLFILTSLYGCVALFAGAAGGAGTAAWLSGKIVQDVAVSFERTVKATRTALDKLNLPIIKETMTSEVAQFISEYSDGRKVWVDVHSVTANFSRIEVRVGIKGDESAARKILDKILARL